MPKKRTWNLVTPTTGDYPDPDEWERAVINEAMSYARGLRTSNGSTKKQKDYPFPEEESQDLWIYENHKAGLVSMDDLVELHNQKAIEQDWEQIETKRTLTKRSDRFANHFGLPQVRRKRGPRERN